MLRQFKQIFRSPKFVVGFSIFTSILIMSMLYPLISPVHPLQSVSKQSFTPPGRYVNIQDTIQARGRRTLELDLASGRIDNALSESDRELMISFLEDYKDVEPGLLNPYDTTSLLAFWLELYDPDERFDTMIRAERTAFMRMNTRILSVLGGEGIVIAMYNEDGVLEADMNYALDTRDFVNINDIANTFTFPLGSDNFGRDMLTQLFSAILVSLRLGLIAGCVATAIGLFFGLVSGYAGGVVDDFIMFITNVFTVIPGFVLLILISYSINQNMRSVGVVAVVIGVTAWPWTCRSVRSQVISLRNRDHVNLSKLSGHSMPWIILSDILPYIASYVVMALILQISSAILAEAQLSMLGLGTSTTEMATLGLMMYWAQIFSAWQMGAWWAFLPVIFSIAGVTFSLHLMNTGLDQVFNPQLREG